MHAKVNRNITYIYTGLWYSVRCVPSCIIHTEDNKKNQKGHHVAKDNSVGNYLIFISKRKWLGTSGL